MPEIFLIRQNAAWLVQRCCLSAESIAQTPDARQWEESSLQGQQPSRLLVTLLAPRCLYGADFSGRVQLQDPIPGM